MPTVSISPSKSIVTSPSASSSHWRRVPTERAPTPFGSRRSRNHVVGRGAYETEALFGVRAQVLRAPRCPAANRGGAGTETAVRLTFTAT